MTASYDGKMSTGVCYIVRVWEGNIATFYSEPEFFIKITFCGLNPRLQSASRRKGFSVESLGDGRQ